MAGRRIKTQLPAVDRSLEDVWRRLDALERVAGTPEAIAQTIVNNTTVLQTVNEGVQGAAYLYGTTSTTTSASRRWLGLPNTAAATALSAAGYYAVPTGMTRITAISIAVFTAGTGAATVTYTVTVGTASAETDTIATLAVPNTGSGTFTGGPFSAPCTPGQAIRLAVNKSAAVAAGQAGVVVYVQLAAA